MTRADRIEEAARALLDENDMLPADGWPRFIRADTIADLRAALALPAEESVEGWTSHGMIDFLDRNGALYIWSNRSAKHAPVRVRITVLPEEDTSHG